MKSSPVSFIRRSSAAILDLMLAMSVSLVIGGLTMAGIMSLTKLENIEAGSWPANLFFIYLLILPFLFYGWFWLHGGQTLGLKMFGLRIQRFNDLAPDWPWAFKRYVLALIGLLAFGAGYLWILFNRKRLTFHDIMSNSTVTHK